MMATLDLADLAAGRVARGEPLAPLTTFGVGGPADWLLEPADPEDAGAALAWAAGRGLPWTVLGGGSNVLIADAGIRGLVIRAGAGLARLERPAPDRLIAGAGLAAAALVAACLAEGWGGLEFLAGIPGTLGGAAAGNAGTAEIGLADRILAVEAWAPEGPRRWPASALQAGYRQLALPEPAVITALELAVEPSSPETVSAAVAAVRARRHGQPTGQRSAGCFFRNPPGDAAGRLIDACGLKGRQTGGAQVSTVHANYIVCRGHATAADVAALAHLVQAEVHRRTGIILQPEVRFLGEWERAGMR